MSRFVHIAPAKAMRKIKTGGLKQVPVFVDGMDELYGVFALPVLPDFYVSHQWMRELKRSGARTMVGIYFKIPDQEEVIVGHYAKRHRIMTAAEAEGLLRRIKDPLGYEVIIPRKIEIREIHNVRSVPRVTGWRYWPTAHGTRPCGCPVCAVRGGIKSRAIRQNWKARNA